MPRLTAYTAAAVLAIVLVLPGLAASAAWQNLLNRADSLARSGDIDTAQVVFHQAIQSAENEFALSDTTVELTLFCEGRPRRVYFAAFSEAEQLYVRALEVAERLYGPDHLHTAELLDRLVQLYRVLSRDAEAKPLSERAVSIAESQLGSDHPTVGEYVDRLGLIEYWLDNNDEAEALYKRALTIAERSFGPDHPQVAVSLLSLANLYRYLKRYEEAESYFKRSLTIREKVYKPDHLEVAAALVIGRKIYSLMKDYAAAEVVARRLVAIYDKTEGISPLALAAELDNLGVTYNSLGRFSEELIARERALKLLHDNLGDSHPDVLRVARAIAFAKVRLGRYTEAESEFKSILKLTEEALGSDHISVASILGQLAVACQEQGRLTEAEELLLRAITLRERASGTARVDVAYNLINIGIVYLRLGDLDKAESSLNRALSVWEQAYGSDYREMTFVLLNLGLVYEDQGRFTEADSVLKLSIDIAEKKLGLTNPALAHALNNQANLYVRLGRYDEAETSQLRAISILEEALGSGHPEVAKFRRDLGHLYAFGGKTDAGLDSYDRFIDLCQRYLENVFPYSSEEQKLRWVSLYPLVDETLYSLALQQKTRRSLNLSLEMLLKSKAMVLEAVMGERRMALCVYDEDLKARLAEHNELCTEIANLSIAGVAYLDTLKVLYRIKDSLETQLSLHCSEFGDALAARRFELADVSEAIPSGSVLWEYVRYRPTDLSPSVLGDDKLGPERYMAFTLDGRGNINAVDLGLATEIDSLILGARDMIYKAQVQVYSPAASQAEARLNEVTGQLHGLLFAPLVAVSPGKKDICISPDGMLNLLPFEILPLSDSSYVIESYRLSYLSCGRDLVRPTSPTGPGEEVVILADADFDAVAAHPRAVPMFDTTEVYGPRLRGGADCMKRSFTRLSHTRIEADSLASRFKGAGHSALQSYCGNQATEAVLKSLSESPRVLHLATHGFFCGSPDTSVATVRDNPLLRSGLALAGANRAIAQADTIASGEDGILTAFEVSGLNLVGTELVVLSACESGVGELISGEGVFGLRRAFQHAGAETVVMSLWAVPDRETSQLMDGFYRRWLGGMSKRDALRESALELLNQSRARRGCGHPLLWGGFILTGNPN
ncbi:MAG: CHAT domain-containing protein [Candidatus Zixiibacteriota bacterium]|nr:MAG: CHAT domain-containing protein [candidate division Zixibacteria bacterium]